MKKNFLISLLCLLVSPALAQSWGESPYATGNSAHNPDNSPLNPKNSPLNPDNSRYNRSAGNGIFDPQGNRTGYRVERPDGGANLFDQEGNRTGYQPSPPDEANDFLKEE